MKDEQCCLFEPSRPTILVKNLETLVCVFPFPNLDLDITVVSVLQNTRGSTLGMKRGTFE